MNFIKSLPKTKVNNLITYAMVTVAFIVLTILKNVGGISNSLKGQLIPICAYIVMAISLNLTVGILGELSLGHAGFMSIGAFTGVTAAICMENAITSEPIRLIISMIIGGIFAGILGLIIGIPVLRLQGDYLAIVTLAFCEIIKNVLNCMYIGLDSKGLHINMTGIEELKLEENAKVILNGPMGVTGINRISTFTFGFILIMFSLFVVLNFINSRAGRAVMSVRDNRIAAESVGISISRYKLTAFIISAFLAGMAGVLFGMNFSTIDAGKFDFNTSILILVFVVLGGMGNIRGSIISTVILVILPEALRSFSKYRMLIYAIVLIAVMLLNSSKRFDVFKKNLFSKYKSLLKRKGGKANEQ